MAGTLEVLTGAEAVARTERVLCADAVTSDASAAEGLSATGCRAAQCRGPFDPADSSTSIHGIGTTGNRKGKGSGKY